MRRLLLLILPAVLLFGCDYLPLGFTDIGEIRSNPASFEGKEVKVRGEVVDITRIPFIDTRIYTLGDGTGEITVFAAGELPRPGEKVAVRGTVESAAIIAGESFGVRIREGRRLPGFLAGGRKGRPGADGKE